MHPALLQLLAAEQMRDKIEKAEDWRWHARAVG